jgi:hypothetical protein
MKTGEIFGRGQCIMTLTARASQRKVAKDIAHVLTIKESELTKSHLK